MGVSGQRHAPTALLPPEPIVQEAGWAPEPVWTQRIEEKSSAPAGDRTPIVRSSILFEVRTELLNIMQTSFGSKELSGLVNHCLHQWFAAFFYLKTP
jgi:hypothetical protein